MSPHVLLIGADARSRARIAQLLDQATPEAVLEEEPDALAAAERISTGEHDVYVIRDDAGPVGGLEMLHRAMAATGATPPPAIAMLSEGPDEARKRAAESTGHWPPLPTMTSMLSRYVRC